MSRLPVLAEREKTHGDWTANAQCVKEFREWVDRWDDQRKLILPPNQKEALYMLGVKLSRILNGDNFCQEHWEDSVGYLTLGMEIIYGKSRLQSRDRSENEGGPC